MQSPVPPPRCPAGVLLEEPATQTPVAHEGIRQSRPYDGRVVDVPEPQQIMDALRGAGWLLEQSTADALSDHEFVTKLGFAYREPQDPDISRELDVSGFKQVYRNEDLRIEVTARVWS